MKRLGDELYRRYRRCFYYLIELKKFIYLSIVIFFFFSFVGFFVPMPDEIKNELIFYFKQLVSQTSNYSFLEMASFLFTNNSGATFIGIFSGLFFGTFSLFNIITNGFVLGFASFLSVSENGIFSLFRLLPHGIFELPALFISLGAGIFMGSKFIERYFKVKGIFSQFLFVCATLLVLLFFVSIFYSFVGVFVILFLLVLFGITAYFYFKDRNLRNIFIKSINLYFFIILPLLVFAAIIEGLLIVFF